MNRTFYHPVNIGADFIRKNVFDLIITSGSGTTSFDSIQALCKNIVITLPNTNSVQVPWIGGIMQVAGRLSQAFTFTATFLVGQNTESNSSNYNTLKALYDWRNMVFDHDTGAIRLANNYKRTGNIHVWDVTGENLQYDIQCEGMWPTNIPDITLEVSDDSVLEVSTQFAADKIFINGFGS
jgi:hypothetical protein